MIINDICPTYEIRPFYYNGRTPGSRPNKSKKVSPIPVKLIVEKTAIDKNIFKMYNLLILREKFLNLNLIWIPITWTITKKKFNKMISTIEDRIYLSISRWKDFLRSKHIGVGY